MMQGCEHEAIRLKPSVSACPDDRFVQLYFDIMQQFVF
jgi:hypothetical protein